MKTVLLPKKLANEKKWRLCKTSHAVVLRRSPPPPGATTFSPRHPIMEMESMEMDYGKQIMEMLMACAQNHGLWKC